jgi:RND family efflux transporter MFP subunit
MKIPPLFPLSLTLVALAGCHPSAPPRETPPALPPAGVTTAPAGVGTNQAVEQVVGTVHPRTKTLVSAKVSGRVKTLVSRIGRTVKAGETLAELDAAEIAARVEQARAGLENAERELDRYRTLLEQKAVTRSEFDAVQARQRIAKAALAEAQSMQDYTTITAPFDGVIARQLADIGDLAAPGRPLLELESVGGLRFESDIPEALDDRIRLGENLSVQIDGVAAPLKATVAEIAPAANPLSRTLRVKLDLPQVPGLRAGHFGRLSIPVSVAANLRVPLSAVLQRGQMEIVFAAVDGRAQLRLVKTGKRYGDQVEILSGLDADEPVITSGHAQLRDGQPLTLHPPQ